MSNPVVQHQRMMWQFLARKFPRLSEQDRHDIVQDVSLRVLTKLVDDPTFEPNHAWCTYLCAAARNEALACLRRLELGWFQTMSEEFTAPPGENSVDAPAIVAEAHRRERQTLLLSDVLREFTASHEGSGQHAVYERRMRGQETPEIATAMRLTEDNVYKHLSRARKWVRNRIEQADVERTVFQTFLCDRRDVPSTKQLPPGVPANFFEVLRIVIEEAGAMCPSPARLEQFRITPHSPEFHDIHYHVVEAQCVLCIV